MTQKVFLKTIALGIGGIAGLVFFAAILFQIVTFFVSPPTEALKQPTAAKTAVYVYSSAAHGSDRAELVEVVDPDIETPNRLVTKFWDKDYVTFFDSFRNDREWLFLDDDRTLSFLDVTTGSIVRLIEAPEGTTLRSAAISHDRTRLAYSLVSGPEHEGGTGELWIYDIAKKKHQKVGELKDLALYAGLSIAGWNSNDTRLIVRSAGGDGGGVWGDVFIFDLKKPNLGFQKVIVPEEQQLPFLSGGLLSPDGERLAYAYCRQPQASEIPDVSDCPAGEELIIYSFATGEHRSVYRNTMFADNIYAPALRFIQSPYWVDDETVMFSTVDGIFSVTIASKRVQEIQRFWAGDPKSFIRYVPVIMYADMQYVVFSGGGPQSATMFLNRETGKILEMFTVDRIVRDVFPGRTQ